MPNTLYYGDNLDILRQYVPDESVDLIYLDPPFNSNASYNVLFKEQSGEESPAQIKAFTDTWEWTQESERVFEQEIIMNPTTPPNVKDMITAFREFIGRNAMMAYLVMMTPRLVELRRVLKPTGSIYLHCDPTASHYLKLLLDAIFGSVRFRSEINWRRTNAHNDAKQGRRQYGNVRDTIFFYTQGNRWTWNWLYTEYNSQYVDSFYNLTEQGSGRRYQMDNLTAAKPGGDTSYEWRVKRPRDEGWEPDLTNEYLHPVEGWEYKGVLPYNGRYWAYSKDGMTAMAEEGRIAYTRNGTPRYKRYLDEMPGVPLQNDWTDPVFPILGVFRLNGQPKRDDGMIFGSCKARQSPVYPIRDAFLAVNHASCPSLSSSGPRQWGESALKTSRLPGALSLLAKSWLYPPSAWRRR